MTILIRGGAGYIGSGTVELLTQQRRSIVVLDSLLTGHRDALDPDVPFVEGDITNGTLVEEPRRTLRRDCMCPLGRTLDRE